jgi:hypothetical protein
VHDGEQTMIDNACEGSGSSDAKSRVKTSKALFGSGIFVLRTLSIVAVLTLTE